MHSFLGKRKGVERAMRWLRAAAFLDFPRAYFEIGHYLELTGDYEQAYYAYRNGTYLNDPACCTRLGDVLLTGELHAHKSTSEAIYFYDKATDHITREAPDGPYKLSLLLNGSYPRVNSKKEDLDPEESTRLLKLAAAYQSVPAMRDLAQCYEIGSRGVMPDPTVSRLLYAKAAEQGDVPAMLGLARWHSLGSAELFPPNPRQAFRWWEQAGKLGSAEAAFRVSVCYSNGSGVKRSDAYAEVWLQTAKKLAASSTPNCVLAPFKARKRSAP